MKSELYQRVLYIAKKNGQKKIYFTSGGIGDGLAFSGAIENFKRNNNILGKILINHKQKELFYNNPNVEFIDFGFYVKTYLEKTKNLILDLKNIGLDLIFLDYKTIVKLYDEKYFGYPNSHIITELAKKMVISGEIELKPKIYLTDEEKSFGKFFETKQIAIISGSEDETKNYGYKNFQEIVDSLKSRFNFVQIGKRTDKKLDGAMDLRGKYSIREVASILYNSDLFVGEIGGLMHLARAVDTRAVIAYSTHEPKNLAYYSCNKNIFSDYECKECFVGENSVEVYCKHNFNCMKEIKTNKMISAIEDFMKDNKKADEIETVYLKKENSKVLDPVEILEKNFYQKKIIFLGLTIFKIKVKVFIEKKYYLFGFINIMKIIKKLNHKKIYIFNILFFDLIIFEEYKILYLFKFIPLLKIQKFRRGYNV